MLGYEEFIDILDNIIKRYTNNKRKQREIKKGFKAKYFNGGYDNCTIDEVKSEITTYCFETAMMEYYDRLGKLKGV